MTQADSAQALRMSLDSDPTPGDGASVLTPLPDGWASFCSKPYRHQDEDMPAHWYATPPWHVDTLRLNRGPQATMGLEQTVHAPTWQRLHIEVAKQCELYDRLIAEEGG